MHVLCIFEALPVSGGMHRKEGVYPLFIKAHARCSIKTAVATLRVDDAKDHIERCASLGSHYIVPISKPKPILLSRYIYTILKHAGVTSLLSWPPFWLIFIWRHGSLLGAIDEYMATNGRPDIIAGLTSIGGSGRGAYLIGKYYDIPYVSRENRSYYSRGLVHGSFKKMITEIVRSASAIFPVSPQLGENIKSVLSVEIPNLITLQNAVTDDFFQKPDRLPDWMQDFSKGRFIFAGWANWVRELKRIDIAIKAFTEVNKKFPNSCLIIAGPVPEWTKSMIDSLGLDQSILLTGALNREEIHNLAHGCDCCIVPSDYDTGNNSVLEAMAAGKPVVVTRCGGSESRITDPSLGRVVERGDQVAFAMAMEDVFQSRSSFDDSHISNECRRLYSEQAFARTLLSAYRKILHV